MTGTVVCWKPQGYGFIHIHDDLPNVYVHRNVIMGDIKSLPVGAKVNFKICDAPKGRVQACRVELHERGLEFLEKHAAKASNSATAR